MTLNNIMASSTLRLLSSHYRDLSSSIEKLASGSRINRAADDPAGMAISNLMSANIASLDQGVRNTNDAVSLVQTADGAMQEIDNLLIRMKELAEQAATGTYDAEQRAIIDSEYQQLASEITRIANGTEFNGRTLLDGSMTGEYDGSQVESTGMMKIHFGSGNETHDYFMLSIGSVSAEALGIGTNSDGAGFSISTQEGAASALQAIEAAIISKDNIRAHLGAVQNRLDSTVNSLEVQSDNLLAAESRIKDLDVAAEMTKFMKSQILTNSAISMLAQANSLSTLVQQLVK